MIYPGYTPREGVEPILLHYGLPFKVGNWSFNKLEHHDDDVVYECNRIFPPPPFPREVGSNFSFGENYFKNSIFLHVQRGKPLRCIMPENLDSDNTYYAGCADGN